ncbi:hypothetical protein BH23PLA1_BH23PLA1_30590 [soil metagenome]
MDEATARIILYAITAVGVFVWLWGLQFLIAAAREGRGDQVEAGERFEVGEAPAPDRIRGSAEVAGTPADLSLRAAAALADPGPNQLGLVKVLERTDDRLVFEGLGPNVQTQASGTSSWTGLRRGEMQFKGVGPDRTRIDFMVDRSGGRWLLGLGGLFQAMGLIALVGGFWAMQSYVIPAANLGVRGQVFQMMQVVHFLWPPFLFGQLYRVRRRALRTGLEVLVHNLPYRLNGSCG